MIVLDTNVVSEAMKPVPLQSVRVLRWLAMQAPVTLYVTVLTIAEITAGLEVLPAGQRKTDLQRAADRIFDEVFAGRVLAFDRAAARNYGLIGAARRRAGLAVSIIDAQIAAICRSVGMAVATRNVADFAECGVEVVDPWTAA